jgi:hypothetical protein
VLRSYKKNDYHGYKFIIERFGIKDIPESLHRQSLRIRAIEVD